MSQKQVKKIKINGEMIKVALEAKGLTAKQVSKMIGRGHDHVGRAVREGDCLLSDLIAICSVLGIEYDKCLIKEPEPVIEEDTREETQVSNNDIVEQLKAINITLNRLADLYQKVWIDTED